MNLGPQLNESGGETYRRVRLWLRLIPNFEAHAGDGKSVLPVSKKARALLAMVAANMPQPLRRDTAAALLWSNKSREHAANSLRQALRELQAALVACGQSPLLLTGGGRLSLQPDAVWLDVHDPAAIRRALSGEADANPPILCQNLQGLDPALDAHFERLWKNVVFQQAFVSPPGSGAPPGPAEKRPVAELYGGAGPVDAGADFATDGEPGQGWRIAVLPFRCLGAPVVNGLSLGMAEEVSAALAKFRMPRLIATGSFWTESGPAKDALDRCRVFNLNYAISGTIQVSGSRMRVTVTLLDVAMDLEIVWASRFEGTTDDLFTLQDTIASQTVAQIDPELLQRQQFRDGRVQTPNAAAHSHLLSGIQGLYRSDRVRFFHARDELQAAIALDPNYAAPHAWLAYWYISGMAEGWIGDMRQAAIQAGEAAERAVALDRLDARGLTIAGHVKAYLEHNLQAASDLHERAILLNPNLPIAWTLSAWSRIYEGDHQTAVDRALMAESLSPNDPHVFAVEHAAMTAKFFMGDLESADRYAASSLERRPRHATALKVRLAILGHLGRTAEAAAYLEAMRPLGLEMTVDAFIARPPLRERDRAFYAEGLRLAGVRT